MLMIVTWASLPALAAEPPPDGVGEIGTEVAGRNNAMHGPNQLGSLHTVGPVELISHFAELFRTDHIMKSSLLDPQPGSL
jgi:hypothetical protein